MGQHQSGILLEPILDPPLRIGVQVVLITGASEGMGKSVAKQLARKGANVIIVSRNAGRLEEALAEIKTSSSFQYI
jgi:short-subunit dehydrogenase